ncbi:MAG TPA: 2-C-methyl-D-erythritol 4-phosphate cytidylyltransferase [Verrucomicrobiae bacterium]|nr:2-C-methyl-D-erythritol 4-phosphate cytidylyltransferase [Verrucomicrobiae bacterium]
MIHSWGAVVVAAGRGTRFGRPKQLLPLAGLPLAAWSIRTFAQMPEIAELIVVTEPEWVEAMQGVMAQTAERSSWQVVEGGATRQQSVYAGLRALSERCEAALIHDGARPLVRAAEVRAGMREVRDGRGSLLAVPVVDTIKVVDAVTMSVERTLARETLWAAQTPQFGLLRELRHAHEEAQRQGFEATDDASLLERAGIDVVVVPGSSENFKVTLPEDLARAEALMRERFARSEAES